MVYVGFWRRVGAHLIDSVIIAVLGVAITVGLIFLLSGASSESNAQAIASSPAAVATPAPIVVAPTQENPPVFSQMPADVDKLTGDQWNYVVGALMLVLQGVIFVTGLVYHTAFTASRWQATPGKRLVGAMVVSKDGKRIGILRAFARQLCTVLSLITLLIGYIMIAFTREKTALHDLICGTRVIRGEA